MHGCPRSGASRPCQRCIIGWFSSPAHLIAMQASKAFCGLDLIRVTAPSVRFFRAMHSGYLRARNGCWVDLKDGGRCILGTMQCSVEPTVTLPRPYSTLCTDTPERRPQGHSPVFFNAGHCLRHSEQCSHCYRGQCVANYASVASCRPAWLPARVFQGSRRDPAAPVSAGHRKQFILSNPLDSIAPARSGSPTQRLHGH